MFANPLLVLVAFIVFYLISCVKVLREYERGVIFRLGRLLPRPKGPGIIFVFKPVDKIVRVSLRLVALDVPPQDIITKDNVSVQVNAVIYFRVMDPNKAITEVENYGFATSQMAQTTLRSVVGERELDELLSDRETINDQLQDILDKQTDPWGIKVSNVEIKHVDLTEELKRAMARQAEAERERRAKIIGAEAEFQAATKLVEAAKMMEDHPMALQMRYLQTLSEIATENNSTTLFPIPMDLIKPFLGK
ncbi:MAG TPA: slipin family protein [bacterium]|jgi:regulator of protease activity HflC (stomatin/prohibitin superfamily)|nr:slipin family protein [Myxococcales bacterium]OQA60942.1 MAG: FtsH protease regulator HflK [bacterium ADurb.Bin270]HPW45843.1 slipin family protein [bacterium]HQH81169.1 slipin family protein [bacterium]